MSKPPSTSFNEQIYLEACEWFVEFRAGDLDAEGRRKFDGWARKSPEHLAAYVEIAAIWNHGSGLDLGQSRDIDRLLLQAKTDPANVVPLGRRLRADLSVTVSPDLSSRQTSHKFEDKKSRATWPLPRRYKIVASIAAAVFLIAGALFAHQALRAPIYTTTFGEQRSITLTDGSVIDINSRSKIRVRYSAQERDVDLLEGQALFHVAKNHARPFIVSNSTTQVRAVGTEFDVNSKIGGTVVTVVEGRVAVMLRPKTSAGKLVDEGTVPYRDTSDGQSERRGTGPSVFLSAGEQVLITPAAMKKVDHPNIAIATVWTQRQLQFEAASLLEVAEEFNRYNERQLVIEDPTLYGFHISGVFSSSDPASLVRFLRERPGVRVTETASQIRVSRNTS